MRDYPRLTRQHFRFIARMLTETRDEVEMDDPQFIDMVNHWAQELRYTNPSFGEGTFYLACGLTADGEDLNDDLN